MRFYSTEYVLTSNNKEQKFNGNIWAPSFEAATELAILRNINERVLGVVSGYPGFDPCPLPSTFYKNRDLIECTHVLVFYGWLASKAKAADCDSLLNDHGAIHEILHEMHHPNFYSFRQEVMDMLIKLEESIPGLKTYIGVKNHNKVTE